MTSRDGAPDKAAPLHRALSPAATAMSVLAFESMPFNSKRVDIAVGTDPAAFRADLGASVDAWRADGTTAVWISCPALAADCIVAAAELGFGYHHAEGDQAMLNIWLSTATENKIPTYATHTVGVGGFVMNDDGEVLVVKEKASGDRAQYKLPGGMADLGEDLAECASREVWEETGVKTEFDTLVAFRHRHNEGIGGRSNIYFVVRLKPTGSTEITMDESELSECKWMPLDEYISIVRQPSPVRRHCLLGLSVRERALRARAPAGGPAA
jgi:ADP-ribose pyrophosphatase YjhB (NUDIX family)